jgi:hypothetical protein
MQDKKGNAAAGQLEQETAAIQQVRELLFGRQVQEIQAGMRKQQEFFAQELEKTREDWLSRLKALELAMKNEHAAIHGELRQEQAERQSVVQGEQRERADLLEAARIEQDIQREALKSELGEELENLRLEHGEELEALRSGQREQNAEFIRAAKELAASDKALDKKLAELAEKSHAAGKALRELTQTENAALKSRLEACHQEALGAVSATALELRQELVSRAALSSLFSASAREVGGDAPEPAKRAAGNK